VAGVVALANEQQREEGGPSLGFLNPLLYAVGASDPGAFLDITAQKYGTAVSGDLKDNRLFDYNGDGVDVTPGPIAGWPTTAGWDLTTGFGTPHAAALVAALRTERNAQP
jgi:hypothetical protein